MIEKQGNSKLQSYGITVPQFKMLVALHLIPDGAATLKELEKYFGVAQSTAAGIVETERHLLSGLTPEEETQLHDLLQKVYDTMDS